MRLFVFPHDDTVKPGCCGWETSATYWMAESREAAGEEIAEHTVDGDQPHGLCGNCMANLLASDEYDIVRVNEA